MTTYVGFYYGFFEGTQKQNTVGIEDREFEASLSFVDVILYKSRTMKR